MISFTYAFPPFHSELLEVLPLSRFNPHVIFLASRDHKVDGTAKRVGQNNERIYPI